MLDGQDKSVLLVALGSVIFGASVRGIIDNARINSEIKNQKKEVVDNSQYFMWVTNGKKLVDGKGMVLGAKYRIIGEGGSCLLVYDSVDRKWREMSYTRGQ